MFCANCGNPMKKEQKFCAACGAGVAVNNQVTGTVPTPAAQKKSGNRRTLIVGAALLAVIVLHVVNFAGGGGGFGTTCSASGCRETPVAGGNYCVNHTCADFDCRVGVFFGVFCSDHRCSMGGCDAARLPGRYTCAEHACAVATCITVARGRYCIFCTCSWNDCYNRNRQHLADRWIIHEVCAACEHRGRPR